MKLGQVIDIIKDKIFRQYLEWLRRVWLSSRAYLICQPAPITCPPIMTSFQFVTLLNGWTGAIENATFQLLKINRYHYKGPVTSFQSSELN